MNCNEMAVDRLTVCEKELLYAFAHLVSISSYFSVVILIIIVIGYFFCFGFHCRLDAASIL